MQRKFPNLCINSSQLNQAVLGRQILGSNLEFLNVICVRSLDLIGMRKCILGFLSQGCARCVGTFSDINKCVNLTLSISLLFCNTHTTMPKVFPPLHMHAHRHLTTAADQKCHYTLLLMKHIEGWK